MSDVTYPGLYKGICVTNADPTNRGRIKVKVPMLTGNEPTNWVEPCFAPGSNTSPAPDDGVWIAYEAGHIDHPVWVGVYKTSGSM